MKKYIFLLLFIVCSGAVLSQDIIVLRKDESELKCRIIAMNDTIIYYRKWKTPGTAKYTIKRNEVLSYTLENSLVQLKTFESVNGDIYFGFQKVDSDSKRISNKSMKENSEQGFLGRYLSDEIVDGYIVLNSGDTLNGLIYVKNVALNQVVVSFKGDDVDRREYSYSEISGYSYNNLHYKIIPDIYTKEVINGKRSESGNLLLHQTLDGAAKLYVFFEIKYPASVLKSYENPPAYMGKLSRYYVIENEKGERQMNKGRSLRKILSKLFADDDVMLRIIYASSPKEEDLPVILKNFNERHPAAK